MMLLDSHKPTHLHHFIMFDKRSLTDNTFFARLSVPYFHSQATTDEFDKSSEDLIPAYKSTQLRWSHEVGKEFLPKRSANTI